MVQKQVNQPRRRKRTQRPGSDSSGEEEPERRRSKGIAIRDREREIKKKEKKKRNNKKSTSGADEFKTEKTAKKKKNLPEPELSADLRSRMSERAREFGEDDISKVALVMQKVLKRSDLARNQNRLVIPGKQVKEGFLNSDQEEYLSERDGIHRTYIPVPIIEPTGGVSHLPLRRWEIGSTSVSYILNGDWKDVVSLNKLREGQIVAVWAFWIKEILNLAFVFSDAPATATEVET